MGAYVIVSGREVMCYSAADDSIRLANAAVDY